MVTERIQRESFDSRLDGSKLSPSRNAELILTMRVHAVRCDPVPGIFRDPTRIVQTPPANVFSDFEGGTTTSVRWGDQEWTDWSSSLERVVEEFMNGPGNRGRFWLVPSAYWGMGWPAGGDWAFLPNIKCLLNLIRVGASSRRHMAVSCYRLQAGAPALRSSTTGHTMQLSHQNLAPSPTILRTFQTVAVHEFLHALGLMHVHYPYERDTLIGQWRTILGFDSVKPNDVSEYGVTPRQRANIMGGGNTLEGWNFWPWLNRLQQHLEAQYRVPHIQWTLVDRRPTPWPREAYLNHPMFRR